MTPSIIVFLIILTGALALFISERVRIDVTALLVILALAFSGQLSTPAALSGFSSEAALITAGVFVISAGLAATGFADRIGFWVRRAAGNSEWRTLLVVMPVVAILAAFTHQLMVVAMMMPVLLRLARNNQFPASRLLMPMAFAASLGTTITVISAPAFLIANSLLHRSGYAYLGVFSVAPIGLVLSVLGTLYLLLVHWLLPRRENSNEVTDLTHLDRYFTEITIPPGSRWAGRIMEEFMDTYRDHLQVSDWIRQGVSLPRPFDTLTLLTGDVLLVQTTPEEIAGFTSQPDLALHAVAQAGEVLPQGLSEKAQGQARLFQAMVAPQSMFIGQTLGEVNFPGRFGIVAVGLWRRDGWFDGELARTLLEAGDQLVLWGPPAQFRHIANHRGFLMLAPLAAAARARHKAPLAVSILLGSVALAASGLTSPALAFLAGAVAMVITRCLPADQAYRSIDLRPFMMIAGAIPLGLAMEQSGTATWFANWIGQLLLGWQPFYILLALFAAAALLTQILSDAATTAL
ncbi:MAG TPA: SLC13 family permease, partial [Mizugakiibacter sp.]|nr:SLC13 family permease [Mizugakiibacter sp.]